VLDLPDEGIRQGRILQSGRRCGAQRTLPQKMQTYSSPEVRKRFTGSASRTGCRLNIQRATAIPNAAYQK
jgi:hypothetical protein